MRRRRCSPIRCIRCAPVGKTFAFRFVGGPRDGQESRSDAPVAPGGPINDAQGFWFITKGGTVGRAFKGPSPGVLDRALAERFENIAAEVGPVRPHRYEVTDRDETEHEVVIICTSVGTD